MIKHGNVLFFGPKQWLDQAGKALIGEDCRLFFAENIKEMPPSIDLIHIAIVFVDMNNYNLETVKQVAEYFVNLGDRISVAVMSDQEIPEEDAHKVYSGFIMIYRAQDFRAIAKYIQSTFRFIT